MIGESVMERIMTLRSMSYRVETEEDYDTLRSVTIYIGKSYYTVSIPQNGCKDLVYVNMYTSDTDTDRDVIIFIYVDQNTPGTYPDMCKALDVITACLTRPYGEILSYMSGIYIKNKDFIEMDPVSYVEYSEAKNKSYDRIVDKAYDRIVACVIREYARSLV